MTNGNRNPKILNELKCPHCNGKKFLRTTSNIVTIFATEDDIVSKHFDDPLIDPKYKCRGCGRRINTSELVE